MKSTTGGSADKRGQSAAIGVILLAGLVVISAGTVGIFAFSSFSDQTLTDPSVLSCEITYQSEVKVTHRGGEDVESAELTVILENASGITRVPFTIASGDDDDRFEVGEVATFGAVAQQTEIRVISPNAVLCRGSVVPTTSSEDGPPSATINDVADNSQCSSPTPGGKCKGNARNNVAEFEVTWSGVDDRSLRDVRINLISKRGTVVDTVNPPVSGSSATGVHTLRDEGGYGQEYTIELTVTDTADQTAVDNVTDTADGTDP